MPPSLLPLVVMLLLAVALPVAQPPLTVALRVGGEVRLPEEETEALELAVSAVAHSWLSSRSSSAVTPKWCCCMAPRGEGGEGKQIFLGSGGAGRRRGGQLQGGEVGEQQGGARLAAAPGGRQTNFRTPPERDGPVLSTPGAARPFFHSCLAEQRPPLSP